MTRGPGRGKLRRVEIQRKGAGTRQYQYVADYTDSAGVRHRVALSTDRAVAEQLMSKLLRERDLARLGAAREVRSDLTLDELRERYLADLGSRAKPSHLAQVRNRLPRIIRALRTVLVRDLAPDAVLAYMRSRQ